MTETIRPCLSEANWPSVYNVSINSLFLPFQRKAKRLCGLLLTVKPIRQNVKSRNVTINVWDHGRILQLKLMKEE